MTDMAPDSIGIRDLLQVMREDMNSRLDRIDRKLDRKAEAERVGLLEERLRKLENAAAMRLDLEDLEARVMSRDSIGAMIGEELRQADSRGWTQKERMIAVGGFLVLVLNLIIGILALGPDLFSSPGG